MHNLKTRSVKRKKSEMVQTAEIELFINDKTTRSKM